jgi:hypothetical protein
LEVLCDRSFLFEDVDFFTRVLSHAKKQALPENRTYDWRKGLEMDR